MLRQTDGRGTRSAAGRFTHVGRRVVTPSGPNLLEGLPQFLIALYYGGLLLGKLLTDDVGSGLALFPAALAAGFWFFGIVLVRLAAVAPLGRSFWETTGNHRNLWLLFIGYSTWLGFFPPTGSKSAVEWGAWVLVIAGLVAVIIFLPW
jgi:hypothetical protein